MVFSAHKPNVARKQGHRNGGSGFVFPSPPTATTAIPSRWPSPSSRHS